MDLHEVDPIRFLLTCAVCGGLSGLSWELLNRRRISLQQFTGALLASSLMALAAACVVYAMSPGRREFQIVAAIMVAIGGPETLRFAVKLWLAAVTSLAKGWVERIGNDDGETGARNGDRNDDGNTE